MTRDAGDADPEAPPPPIPSPPAAPPLHLDLCLAPDDVAALRRLPVLARGRPGRPAPLHLVWHDSPSDPLAPRLALRESRQGDAPATWRLEHATPARHDRHGPAVLPPPLAEAGTPAFPGHALPGGLVPVAAFRGTTRAWSLPDGALVTLVDGTLRAVSEERPACRLSIRAEHAAAAALARLVAARVRVEPPGATLAAEALLLGRAAPPPAPPAARVPAGATIEHALCLLLRHLGESVRFWLARIVAPDADGFSPVPVHQARVACRRLRSALSLFRRAADAPELRALSAALRDLAGLLGAARDWDVFLDGHVAALLRAMPQDPRLARLHAAVVRQRALGYRAVAADLAAGRWRPLALELALLPELRPWRADAPPERLATLDLPAQPYVSRRLDRALSAMLHAGKHLRDLPDEQRHDLRKAGKRLRYAAEFFAPAFPAAGSRRYLRRLAALQESLGLLTDGAVAATLLARLGPAGSGFAGGAVLGWLAAEAAPAGDAAERAWKRLRHAEPFWR
ncbi:MAG: CHAD domain-containing protein [Janthinobacterium lividum]